MDDKVYLAGQALLGLMQGKTVLFQSDEEAAAALGKTVQEMTSYDNIRLLGLKAAEIATETLVYLNK